MPAVLGITLYLFLSSDILIPFIVVSVLRNLVTFVLIHAKTVLLLILLNLKDKTPLGDQHEELHDLQR